MAFEESAPIWIAVPIFLVILVAAFVFTFGFNNPVDQSVYLMNERSETDNGRKKKRKTKAATASGAVVRRLEATPTLAKKRPVSKNNSKSIKLVEPAVAKRVSPVAKPQEKKIKEPKIAGVRPEPESVKEEFGEWEVAKSRKRPQKGKDFKSQGPDSGSGSIADNTIDKSIDTKKPNTKQEQEPPPHEPVVEPVVVVQQNTSQQEDEGPSTGHSEATSTLSESWVNPDEVHRALKEFDLAMATQSNTVSSKDLPTLSNASKKKNKKKKSPKDLQEDPGMAGSGTLVVEEPVSRKEVTPLGDRGNPYRVVEQSSSAPAENGDTNTKATPAVEEEWVEAKVQKKKKRVRRDN